MVTLTYGNVVFLALISLNFSLIARLLEITVNSMIYMQTMMVGQSVQKQLFQNHQNLQDLLKALALITAHLVLGFMSVIQIAQISIPFRLFHGNRQDLVSLSLT
jgi:hypothetical protein